MSRFSLYTLILVGTAVAVFTIGENHPHFVAAPTEVDDGIVAEMPCHPSGKKRLLPQFDDENAPDRVRVVPSTPSVNLSVD